MALDFGMAKARGLIAPIAQVEKEIIKNAGGTNVFKSEAWWNEQYDQFISKGVTEKKTRTETTYPQGFNQYGSPNVFQPFQSAPRNQYGLGTGRQLLDASYFAPVTKTINYTEQRNLNQTELDSISDQSKETTRKLKREANQKQNTGKRKARASSGLLSKSKPVKVQGMAEALPALGSDSFVGVSTNFNNSLG